MDGLSEHRPDVPEEWEKNLLVGRAGVGVMLEKSPCGPPPRSLPAKGREENERHSNPFQRNTT